MFCDGNEENIHVHPLKVKKPSVWLGNTNDFVQSKWCKDLII